jgi:hypothetical protein
MEKLVKGFLAIVTTAALVAVIALSADNTQDLAGDQDPPIGGSSVEPVTEDK